MRSSWPKALVLLALTAGCTTWTRAPDTVPYEPQQGWVLTGPQAAERHAAGAVFLDVRSAEQHRASHPVGALPVTWQEFSEPDDPHRGRLLDDDGLLTQRLQALGISTDTPVVVVGQPLGGWGEDGRIVWMLRTLGHPDAAWVDGGMLALAAAGVAMTDTPTPDPPPGDFAVERRSDWDISGDALRDLWVDSPPEDAVLVDTREPREFAGATPYGESRAGHVPGAVHLHWSDLVNSFGYLLGADALRERLAARGITPDRTVITYCTGGVRSGWLVTVLADLGFPDVRNYAGSMWEWAAQDPTAYPLQ